MTYGDWLLAIRRHGLALGVVLIAVTAVAVVRWSDRTPGLPVAITRVVILPDPRAPLSDATPVLPEYQTFTTKLASITTAPVLARAADLALGERAFRSPEFRAAPRRARIEAGIEALRRRYGTGDEASAQLRRVLRGRVSVLHLSRKQIAEIRAAAETSPEAIFLSWSVAEAAAQHHGERMRRSMHAIVAQLEDEIARIHRELAARQDDAVPLEPTRGQIEVRTRLLQSIALEIAEDELRLQLSTARTAHGSATAKPWEDQLPHWFLRARTRIRSAHAAAEVERIVHATILAPVHPTWRAHEARVQFLGRSLHDLEAEGRDLAARWSTEQSVHELFALDQEREFLDDRRAWLSEKAAGLAADRLAWIRRDRGREELVTRLGDQLEYQRDARRLGEALGSPIVILSPAAGTPERTGPAPFGHELARLLLLGLIAAAGVSLGIELLHGGLRGRRDVEEELGLPLLSVVPREPQLPGDLVGDPAGHRGAASLEGLATSLDEAGRAGGPRTIAVTSAMGGEGRTTFTIRLAATLARRGRRVLLVDGDLRRPAVADRLGLPGGPGLAPCRVGVAGDPWEQVEGAIGTTENPSLDVLTSEGFPPEILPILDEARVEAFLAAAAERYDFIVLDSPALGRAADGLSIAHAAAGTILLARAYRTPRPAVRRASDALADTSRGLLGVVLVRFPHALEDAFIEREDGFEPPEEDPRAVA